MARGLHSRCEPPVVSVEWVDSASSSGWRGIDLSSRDGSLICRSVGYLVARTRSSVTLSTSVAYGNDEDPKRVTSSIDPITIPLCAVRRLRRLPLSAPRAKRR